MMTQLKKLILFRPLIPVIQLKKADCKTKISEIEKEVHNHDQDK